jgi:hypothetical protein
MPKESDATNYRRMFVSLIREIHKLRADHDALMQIFVEELPAADRIRVMEKYDARSAALWAEVVEKLEDSLPNLAAELDSDRPLISPDEKSDAQ